MSLKDNWKETGKNLGNAFRGLGKNVVDSVDTCLDVEKSNSKENVFNDGSWRKTGKDMGKAFKGLGISIIKSAKEGLNKIDTDDEEI